MTERAVILYFSGTGNTKMVAEMIGRALETKGFNVEVISVEERERLETSDLHNCLVGVALRRVTRYGKRFREKIASFADEIIASLVAFKRKPYCAFLLEWFAPVRFLLQRMEGILMKGLYVERAKCRRCMQCVKNCPDDNIYVGANGAIAFKKPDSCVKCLRCISDCPVDAVVFGKFSLGKGRYSRQMRQEYVTRFLGGL